MKRRKLTRKQLNQWDEFRLCRYFTRADGTKGVYPPYVLVYKNNLYQVQVVHSSDWDKVHENSIQQPDVPMFWLSIKMLDRRVLRDWRHLQRIKNELIGEEHEGVEVFPAESRLVDGANQYHMWVFADPKHRFKFGYTQRSVDYSGKYGARQRKKE